MSTKNNNNADLPRWDLSPFGFSSPFDEEIDKKLEGIEKRSRLFKQKYEGQLTESSLLNAVSEMEEIATSKATISSYLSLSYDTALNDDALKKRKGAVSQIQAEIAGNFLEWFELDVANMTQEELDAQFKKDPELSTKYGSYLDELRRQKPHNLEKDVDKLHKKGRRSYITPTRIAKLEGTVGWSWDASHLRGFKRDEATWNFRCHQLKLFKEEFGHTFIPQRYPANRKLGRWVNDQRTQYKLYQKKDRHSFMTAERIDKLNEINFAWEATKNRETKNQAKWNEMYAQLQDYKSQHRDYNVPQGYEANPKLGRWVAAQRKQYMLLKNNKPSPITPERIKKLGELDGWLWDATEIKSPVGRKRGKNKKDRR